MKTEKFKHLGMTVIYENYIHDGIMGRLLNAC